MYGSTTLPCFLLISFYRSCVYAPVRCPGVRLCHFPLVRVTNHAFTAIGLLCFCGPPRSLLAALATALPSLCLHHCACPAPFAPSSLSAPSIPSLRSASTSCAVNALLALRYFDSWPTRPALHSGSLRFGCFSSGTTAQSCPDRCVLKCLCYDTVDCGEMRWGRIGIGACATRLGDQGTSVFAVHGGVPASSESHSCHSVAASLPRVGACADDAHHIARLWCRCEENVSM